MSGRPDHAELSGAPGLSPLAPQRTRFESLSARLGRLLFGLVRGNWRHRSTVLLALLLGFYLGGNLISVLKPAFPGGRPALVLSLVLLLEFVVRLRGRLLQGDPRLGWLVVDNLRIGLVYAVVLEAFKLGS